MALEEMQYQLDELIFGGDPSQGTGTKVLVEDFQIQTALADNRVSRPFEDGQDFGPEFREGARLMFKLVINTRDGDGPELLRDVTRAFWGNPVRKHSRKLMPLTAQRFGETQVFWGRPRPIDPTRGRIKQGYIKLAAIFDTEDSCYYSAERNEQVTFAPTPSGGLTIPFTVPLVLAESQHNNGRLNVNGNEPTYPIMRIRGPIDALEIENVGLWSTEMTRPILNDQHWVEIDTRPWVRTILDHNGLSAAGAFTRQARRLQKLLLHPGENSIVLKGIDPTGTSSVFFRWSDRTGL